MTRGGDWTINEDARGHPYQKIVTDGDSQKAQSSHQNQGFLD